jgi:aminocarboxymuconate-semialdehyde decarboxylase
MVDWAGADLAQALAEAYNDAIAEAHLAHPSRLVGLAALPWRYPERAVKELERASRHPGIRGAYAPTRVFDRDLDDEAFRPVFERIEALGWTLFLHPVSVVEPKRLAPFYLTNLLGNPFESAIAGAKLIFGGVLDRFPGLEVCLPHGGGALSYVIGRLDHGKRVRPELKHRELDASAYLGRFYFDTVTHSAKALSYLIDLVGADRVMLGSDYCFDMGYERPVEVVTGHAGIAPAAQAQILGGTARRLLRL